jgi:NADH-quinone oxidoreductase subunit L
VGVTPLGFVRFLGVCTLFIAATIALVQNDIKRVLAYSTVSQLGYMVMGIGLGSWVAGLFHLMTHAAFKALLFLGSGSVIHGTGTQDMREMGGLRYKMPWTFWTYVAGYLALAGFPLLFAGFWSKDAILDGAHLLSQHGHGWFLILGSLGALLTPFYMTRQMWMVFDGKTRNPSLHVHESGKSMIVPLVLLAIPAVAAGWLGIPKHNLIKAYLDPTPAAVAGAKAGPEMPEYLRGANLAASGVDVALKAVHAPEEHPEGLLAGLTGLNPAVAFPSMAIVLLAIALGIVVYKKAVEDSQVLAADYAMANGLVDSHGHVHEHAHGDVPAIDPAGFWKEPLNALGPIHTFLLNKWYFDELYVLVLWIPCKIVAEGAKTFDKYVVDGAVNSVGRLGLVVGGVLRWVDKNVVDGIVNLFGIVTDRAGRVARQIQTGKVQNYTVALYIGALFLIAVGLWRIPHR